MPAYHARIALEAHDAGTGALVVNVLHAEVDTLTSPPNWNSIAADVGTWLAQEWFNLLSQHKIFDQIVVTDENYPGSTHGQGVHTAGSSGARIVPDQELDAALCEVVSLKTAVAKRYARGHVFLPPAETVTALGGIGLWSQTNAYWLAAQAFAAKFLAGFTAGSTSYTPEVFSRHLVATGVTPFTNKVTSAPLSAKQHWLRSRSTSP